jgi:hypothetical protein
MWQGGWIQLLNLMHCSILTVLALLAVRAAAAPPIFRAGTSPLVAAPAAVKPKNACLDSRPLAAASASRAAQSTSV